MFWRRRRRREEICYCGREEGKKKKSVASMDGRVASKVLSIRAMGCWTLLP